MKLMHNLRDWVASIADTLRPATAHAHEVYVLSPEEIQESLNSPRPEFVLTIQENFDQFLLASVVTISIVATVLMISITRKLEEWLDPLLLSIKKFAPFIMQITLGAALVFSAYYNSLFGIELPLPLLFGSAAGTIQLLMYIGGVFLLSGIFPRVVALLTVLLFVPLLLERGLYIANYLTYFGEALTIFLFGGAYQLTTSHFQPLMELKRSLELHLHKYKFLLLRVSFGISLIYASVYAKFLHGSLALMTVEQYNLTAYFPFDPTFLVLGALVVEILLGLFFMFGFEIRFASLFYLVFLVLSILFFQEAVWPHIILIGTSLAMFTHGYDRYTVGGRLFKRGNLEPIL